jgi:hypothetical protein
MLLPVVADVLAVLVEVVPMPDVVLLVVPMPEVVLPAVVDPLPPVPLSVMRTRHAGALKSDQRPAPTRPATHLPFM